MNMTKWKALFVLALFVVSMVPIVAAESDNDRVDDIDDISVDSANDGDAVSDEAEAQDSDVSENRKKRFESTREELREKAEERRKELFAKRDKARKNIDRQRDQVRDRYQAAVMKHREAKIRFTELREKHEEIKTARENAREKFQNARTELRKQCAANPKSDECIDARQNARTSATNQLSRAAEHILAALERAIERVENSDLSDEKKAAIVEELEASISDIAGAKDATDELGEDVSKEDVKEAAQVIRGSWNKAKRSIKYGIGSVAGKRIGGVIKKMEKLETKFDRVIAKLKENGNDVGAAEETKADFATKLDKAQALHAEANALFEAGDHPAAAEKIRASHAALKEAHRVLKDLVKKIRGIGNGTSALDAVSDEADEDAADEAEDAAEDAAEEAAEDAAEEAEDAAEEAEDAAEDAADEAEDAADDADDAEEEGDEDDD